MAKANYSPAKTSYSAGTKLGSAKENLGNRLSYGKGSQSFGYNPRGTQKYDSINNAMMDVMKAYAKLGKAVYDTMTTGAVQPVGINQGIDSLLSAYMSAGQNDLFDKVMYGTESQQNKNQTNGCLKCGAPMTRSGLCERCGN